MLLRNIFISLSLTAFFSGPAAAQIYKWVDENGTITYTQMPPPAGTRILESPNILLVPSSTSSTKNTRGPDKKATSQPDTNAETETAAAMESRQKRIEKMCQTLRDNLKMLNLSRRVYTVDENGERHYISDEKRSTIRNETEEKIRENCE